ncbi:NUDIX hydrolase [Amycolatopsis nigrescens]|uniref:NUDIX hydrolase n=1 Tax=Amycolatopsis nigrescens TaxID=381445 RepID=UPI00035E1F1F|nr:NUDIX hydrolase [Amycolatopsis nigrescens]
MASLPIHDQTGNTLTSLRITDDESILDTLETGVPLPAALVVVTLSSTVLMVFDRHRGEWELPGGMREPGESARQAAVRELAEETGIASAEPAFAAIAEFQLRRPVRHEYAAIYRTALPTPPALVVNDEIADFRWWDPHSAVPPEMSPLDAEIARRVHPEA